MLSDLKLTHPNLLSGEIWLCQSVQLLMLKYRQTQFFDKEAGGILLGYHRGPHLEVVEASEPMPLDIRRRNSFERKDPGHQDLSDARWGASSGTIVYLGEWHTHPCLKPSPSQTDSYEWGKLVDFHREPLLFLIVGTEYWYVEFKAANWIVSMPGKQK